MILALKILFWFLVFIVFYSYFGYGIIIYIINLFKNDSDKNQKINENYKPEVTLFVAAYNEKDYVDEKVKNSFSLNYPKEKVKHIWVTDGSDDGTPDKLEEYNGVEVYHKNARKGKIAAMNRGMKFVKTPIVIFSDGNTTLGDNSIREIVRLFHDPKVGCVAGEKRVLSGESDSAASSGESFYWKYESFLKKMDAELYSAVGAAGELFAIRTELFEEVEPDTLLDDFMISMRIVMKGYTIQYSPEAYAMEKGSANVKEELKRKIRISAGGIQSVVRLKALLNIFKYGIFSFQYISHKVLRWIVVPLFLLLLIPLNFILAYKSNDFLSFYSIVFYMQILFYLFALMGRLIEGKKIRLKLFFIPYYIFIMNYSVFAGFARYIKGKQKVTWERAKRA